MWNRCKFYEQVRTAYAQFGFEDLASMIIPCSSDAKGGVTVDILNVKSKNFTSWFKMVDQNKKSRVMILYR